MINFLLKIKLLRKCKAFPTSNGMTYVELIVVLGIFAVMSSIIMFNYGEFQAKVDIKNLASDIASKIVEAQKSAINGKWDSHAMDNWKPSYGVRFDANTPTRQFIYFADIGNPDPYVVSYDVGEELDTITITGNNYISRIDQCDGSPVSCNLISNYLDVIFTRPDSKAVFYSDGPVLTISSGYVQITVQSSRSSAATAKIKIYPSGRIQVN